ncbi:unnamed protein product [Peronospora farinosa]|uniref:Uncharacterized protein n=1 Tax=Peronospora farinosa TaxID=134698 RepID=A0ABN8BSE7_9STRA|nr:unnamed protein product [Peronospora farinosa]
MGKDKGRKREYRAVSTDHAASRAARSALSVAAAKRLRDAESGDGRDVASLVRVASDRMLLCCKNAKVDKKSVDSHLDDQLLE